MVVLFLPASTGWTGYADWLQNLFVSISYRIYPRFLQSNHILPWALSSSALFQVRYKDLWCGAAFPIIPLPFIEMISLPAMFHFSLLQETEISFPTDVYPLGMFPTDAVPMGFARPKNLFCGVGFGSLLFRTFSAFFRDFDQNQTSSILPLEFPLWIRLRLYLLREMTPIFTVIWVLKITYFKMAPVFLFFRRTRQKKRNLVFPHRKTPASHCIS